MSQHRARMNSATSEFIPVVFLILVSQKSKFTFPNRVNNFGASWPDIGNHVSFT